MRTRTFVISSLLCLICLVLWWLWQPPKKPQLDASPAFPNAPTETETNTPRQAAAPRPESKEAAPAARQGAKPNRVRAMDSNTFYQLMEAPYQMPMQFY